MKVVTVLGTRPEIIRLSRVISLLNAMLDHVLVHTGQNYDYELNQVFFDDLQIPKPDHFLEADISSLGATIGDIIKKTEQVLIKENPDAMLVLGDTNSCVSAYIAKRLHIPVFHMEAGNRSYDMNVPEETNRKVVDHVSDFNLVYTEHARRHLISEGIPHRRIYLTGSPMKEVLDYYQPKIANSNILETLKLKPKKYFVVSVHREENVDNKDNLTQIVSILNDLANEYELPVIVSTHPRTRKRLEQIPNNQNSSLIQFLKPFGFFDYIKLQKEALCTISDSGTISEESSILSFPAISLRQSMERPEAQDSGAIILSGLDSEIVMKSVDFVINEKTTEDAIPADYTISNTSTRVLKLILGNARLSNKWWGINSKKKSN